MAIESGLAQQASTFVESLNVKPAPSVEKTPDEAGQEMKIPDQGDTVTISQEARALAAPETTGESGQSGEESEQNQIIEQLEKRIEALEKELKEIQDSDLPEKEKTQQVQAKQVQLMELRDQLLKAEQEELKLDGYSAGGGTRAQGFGNSVDSF